MISGFPLFVALFNNLAIFIALVAVYGALKAGVAQPHRATRQLVLGLVFGLFALGCMNAQIPVFAGVRVDQRNAIVALSGAFGGPLAALTTGLIAASYRAYLGGAGVVAGCVGVGLAVIAGSVLHWVRLPFGSLGRGALSALGATATILPGFILVGTWPEGTKLMVAMTVPYGTAIALAIFFGGMQLFRVDLQREAEARFRQMVDVSPEAIIVVNKARKISLFNAKSEAYSGLRAVDVLGTDFGKLSWLGSDAHSELGYRLSLAHDFSHNASPVEFRDRDGERILEATFSSVFSAHGQREWMLNIRDITASRKAEEARADYETRIRQSKSLEALGRLAGGVAHDFNNLLTVILGTIDLIASTEKLSPSTRDDLESIREAATRAAELTAQLLAFGRKQVLEPQVLNPNRVIESLVPLLKRSLPESIILDVGYCSDIANVSVDAAKLDQVLVNLVVNARDAMPQGGTIHLRTAERDLDSAQAADLPEITPGRYVEISVCDTGTGMSTEVLARVFEPFYTTKEAGKGTGLGLATVHGIVRQSGGHIQATSELGKGSCFHVYLPSTTQNPAIETPTTSNTARLSGHVLLVEDDVLVRVPVRRMLASLGFTVTEASGGREALTAYLAATPPINLVLTDVILRDTYGTKVASELRELDPSLAIVFMSGYAENEIVRDGTFLEGLTFIAKPFTLDKLSLVLASVLSSRAPNHTAS